MSRYMIGIDLGTTNTVVYYMDRSEENSTPVLFRIPQLVEFGELDEKDSLPSFLFLPDGKEVPENGLSLPWDESIDYTVGELGRKSSSIAPLKVVSSAKSWLCVDSIDRMSSVLPWNRNNKEKQISPVEASRRILEYIKNAWNSEIASDNDDLLMEKQTVILTVPASFDAVARELTVKAAKIAGLDVVLLEEPQAAIYSWLHETGDDWRKQVSAKDIILVCDIGGGTTDLSLIKVSDEGGNLLFVF